jgi:hypothetical protein
MNITFHLAEGHDDFNAFQSLWPRKFGRLEDNPSALHLMARAFQSGSAILARKTADSSPIAATVLDIDSFEDALFVPFILIADSESKRGLIQQRMLDVVLNAFDASGVARLLFATDDTAGHRTAVEDFNESSKKAGLVGVLRIIGAVDNLYGDNRKVIFHQLFIPSRERPDVSRLMAAAPTASSRDASQRDDHPPAGTSARALNGTARVGAQVLRNRVLSEACCSGCSEKIDKEFKESKDKENKEGVERVGPSTKLNVENTERFALYARIGVQRFNRHAREQFSPLV